MGSTARELILRNVADDDYRNRLLDYTDTLDDDWWKTHKGDPFVAVVEGYAFDSLGIDA